MAEVIVKNTQTIQPAEPTFNGYITLTELDMLGASYPYIPFIYFYKPIFDESETSKSTTLIHRIRHSLSRTLVHFYPFAGRLTRDHNPSDQGGSVVVLQCGGGDGGAAFIEAESCNELAVFGDFSDHNLFHNLVPSVEQYDRKQIHKIPLLLVQLTRFSCGGYVLGIFRSHVVDGRSFGHFMKEWARICRGESLAKPPFMDRTVLLRGGDELPFAGLSSADNDDEIDNLPDKLGNTHVEEKKKHESETTTMVILPLTKTQVEKLKNAAAVVTRYSTNEDDTNIHHYSRYEVITAHIWRCLCKAKGYDENSDILTKTLTVADVRGRVHPPLPSEFFGNGLTRMVTTCSAGQIISNNLGFTCQKLRHSINSISNESITSEIQRLRRQRLNAGQVIQRKGDGSMLKIDLLVTNWLQLPLYGLDFGWGNEICMRRGLTTLNGALIYMRGQDNEEEGLIKVVICLQKSHIENFKNFFYQDL